MNLRIGFVSGLLGLVLVSAAASAEQGDHGSAANFEQVCRATGGDWEPQPPGSSITACCDNYGCVVCDANGNDCTYDGESPPAEPGPYGQAPGTGLTSPNAPRFATPVSPQPGRTSAPWVIVTPR